METLLLNSGEPLEDRIQYALAIASATLECGPTMKLPFWHVIAADETMKTAMTALLQHRLQMGNFTEVSLDL